MSVDQHPNNSEGNDLNIVALSKPYLRSVEVKYLLNLQSNISSLYIIKRKEAMSYLITLIKQLKLPLNILQDASYYYQRFFLFNPLEKYTNTTLDVALASLFIALKSRDFIKKLAVLIQVSNKILMKPIPQNLQQQQKEFEIQRRRIMDLERKFLEIGCFDFRNYSSEEWLIRLGKHYKFPKEAVFMAWNILTDLYCTDSVVKFTANYNALACLKLSLEIWTDMEKNNDKNEGISSESIVIASSKEVKYNRKLARSCMNDLLEYYLENFQNSFLQEYLLKNKTVDEQYVKNFLMNVKIELNPLIPPEGPNPINEDDLYFKHHSYDITKLNSIRFMYNKEYYIEETNCATEFNKS